MIVSRNPKISNLTGHLVRKLVGLFVKIIILSLFLSVFVKIIKILTMLHEK